MASEPTKVVFLDVDGVLNNGAWARRMWEEGVHVYHDNLLEDRALRLLRSLIEQTGAKIVVSSAWRKIPEAMESLCTQLEFYKLPVFDITPYVGGERGDDITAWFNRHPGEYRYVILDDDSDMGEHLDHLVKTNFDEGLTYDKVSECITILNDTISNSKEE